MNAALFPLLWAAALLLAMLGVGRLLAAILRTPAPAGIALALGFAVTASLGALANLAGIISRANGVVYVFAGLACLAVDAYGHRNQARARFRAIRAVVVRERLFTVLLAAAILIAALRVVASIEPYSFSIPTGDEAALPFNPHDDFQAYLVFPEKMLQTGSLGRDPFSERRLLTSLGGGYFWDALLLAELPVENLHLLESGLGLILVLAAAADVATLLKLRRLRMAVLLLLVLMVMHNNMNVTSFMIPAGLMLALLWSLLSPARGGWRNAVIVAVLAAAIAAAKSTLIFPLVVLLVAFPGFAILRDRKSGLKSACILIFAGALTIALLTPWMISMDASFGTGFYPLLGTAGRTLIPTPFPSIARLMLVILPPALALAGYFIVSSLPGFRRARPWGDPETPVAAAVTAAVTAVILAWILGLILVARTAGLDATPRLSFPFAFPAMIFSLAAYIALFDHPRARVARIPGRWLGSALCVGFAMFHVPGAVTLYGNLLPHDLAATLRAQPLFDQAELDAAARLQNAAPPGAVILARLAYPFLQNFRRNPIDIIDWPGGYYLSPPRGMPFFQGAEPLRRYLLSQGIRYVAWSYRSEANFPRRHFAGRETAADPLIRRSTTTTLDFQANLEQLRKSSRILYQDRQNALFDLAEPPVEPPAAR